MDVAIIGCGGIGYALTESVARALNLDARIEEQRLYLVDADTVETGNTSRQFYPEAVGQGKAHVLADRMKKMFPDLETVAIPAFVNPDAIRYHKDIWLKPGVSILAGVDNNASRAFIEDEAAKIKACILVLGGNDEVGGQASLYIRRNGRDISPRIITWTPELRLTDGKMPGMGTCQRSGSPQSEMANKMVAVCMQSLWHSALKPPPRFNEIRFDLREGIMRGFWMDPLGAREGRKET